MVASDVRRVGSPNRPDNAGKRIGESRPIGDSTLISRATSPKKPDKIKRNKAKPIPRKAGIFPFNPNSSILPFSVVIIRIDIAIRTKSMMS